MRLDLFTLDVILPEPTDRITLEMLAEIKQFLIEQGVWKEKTDE